MKMNISSYKPSFTPPVFFLFSLLRQNKSLLIVYNYLYIHIFLSVEVPNTHACQQISHQIEPSSP